MPDGWTFCSNVMSRVHMPWSRGSCVSGITLPWIVRCGCSLDDAAQSLFQEGGGRKNVATKPRNDESLNPHAQSLSSIVLDGAV